MNLYAYCGNNPITNYSIKGSNYFTINNSIISVFSSSLIVMYAKLIPHSLPNSIPKGKSNRTREQYYPDGSLARQRVFDEDGNKAIDHDHHEGEDEAGYDHDHIWDGNNRGKAIPANKIVAVGTLIVTSAGLIWLVANDATGIGVADDAAIPVVATTFVAAWLVLFGEGDNEKW